MPPHFDLPDRQSEMIVATLRFHPGIKRPSGDLLIVDNGIETCLAAMQATGHSAWCPQLHILDSGGWPSEDRTDKNCE
jgi:hypothetical protein